VVADRRCVADEVEVVASRVGHPLEQDLVEVRGDPERRRRNPPRARSWAAWVASSAASVIPLETLDPFCL
jgi:hypothetical protein